MSKIFHWLININLKTRLISVLILVISITISSIAFTSLLSAYDELFDLDSRFCRDLSIILADHIAFLIHSNNIAGLKNFIEKLYLTTSNIHDIGLFSTQGDLLFSFPIHSSSLFRQATDLSSDISTVNTNNYNFCFNISTMNNLANCRYTIDDSTLLLAQESPDLGFLRIGLTSNPNILYSIQMAQGLSVILFVIVWLMFILGAAFNFLIIARPIKKLLIGLRSIASGDFSQQIDDSAKGDVGDLITSFNEMSKRLICYEKKNVVQLISEKARLEALVSTIADGAILLDTELRLLFVNQVAVKVFHWSNEDLIGKIVFQYLPVHVNEALLPILNNMIQLNCLDDKILQAQEVNIDLHYESLKTFRFLLSTVLSHKTRALNGVVITIQDITREAQLNEAKKQFVSNVSHELRTPLCNIQSFLETLIDYDHKLTSQQKNKFLSIAYTETQRLNSLVNDVLNLSRLESQYQYVLTPLLLINIVLYIVKTSQIIASSKKVRLVVEVHDQIGETLAHETSLCQVLSNLISNSLKFTHQGGRIIIRIYPLPIMDDGAVCSKKHPGIVRIEIIDEGIGINRVYQKQIFDRFMRIENNIHTLEGTGLGLSIVKNIVEKHNSKILTYSEVGIGTSFWFDLLIPG